MEDRSGSSGVEASGTGRMTVPPVLYLPCKPGSDIGLAIIEMRQLADGRVALMAYTALDRLGRCCGPHQPWVLFKTEALDELRRESPYDLVVFDQPLPDELRRGPDDGAP